MPWSFCVSSLGLLYQSTQTGRLTGQEVIVSQSGNWKSEITVCSGLALSGGSEGKSFHASHVASGGCSNAWFWLVDASLQSLPPSSPGLLALSLCVPVFL